MSNLVDSLDFFYWGWTCTQCTHWLQLWFCTVRLTVEREREREREREPTGNRLQLWNLQQLGLHDLPVTSLMFNFQDIFSLISLFRVESKRLCTDKNSLVAVGCFSAMVIKIRLPKRRSYMRLIDKSLQCVLYSYLKGSVKMQTNNRSIWRFCPHAGCTRCTLFPNFQ